MNINNLDRFKINMTKSVLVGAILRYMELIDNDELITQMAFDIEGLGFNHDYVDELIYNVGDLLESKGY